METEKNILISFFKSNFILLFSWFCALIICPIIEAILFKNIPRSYLIYWYYLFIAFIIFSIFYSFYQIIKNININKILASVLLIFYLLFWLFFPYVLIDDGIDGMDKNNIIKLFIFILINICIYLCHKFNRQSRTIIPYLLFYGINSLVILIFLLAVGYAHDY